MKQVGNQSNVLRPLKTSHLSVTLSNLPLTNPFPALQNIDGIEMQIQSEVPFTISQSEFHINSQIEFGFMGERDCIKISNVSGKLFIDNYT